MKYLHKYNESNLHDDVFQNIDDLCLDFKDLGLDYRVKLSSKCILVEITDTSYGFQIDRTQFNNIVKTVKDYVENEGYSFFISRFDEHNNYCLNDHGYTQFEDYLKDQGNFYGFEMRIFF